MPPLPAKASLSVENVRVCKLLGGSAADSHVVHGMVVQRDAQVFVHMVLKGVCFWSDDGKTIEQ